MVATAHIATKGLIVFARWCPYVPHIINGHLGPCEATPQTAFQLVWPFLHNQCDQQRDRPIDHAIYSTSVSTANI